MIYDITCLIIPAGSDDERGFIVTYQGKMGGGVVPWPFESRDNEDHYAKLFLLGSSCWHAILYPEGEWAQIFKHLGLDPLELRDAAIQANIEE